jgi:hypothetical protein
LAKRVTIKGPKGTFKVIYNRRNKRYTIFRVNPNVKGFGAYKIVASAKTMREAKSIARKLAGK